MVSTSNFGEKPRYSRVVIVFLYLFLLPHKTYPQTCSSSCGKISNITNPFRLKHDPDHCGNSTYELDCVNNITVLNLYDGYYFVQSINYNNYTIRVVDPNIQPTNCSSLPHFFLYSNNFTQKDTNSYEYSLFRSNSTYEFSDYIDLSRPVIYMECTSPPSNVVDMYYADTTSCMGQHNIYVIVGNPQLGILEPQCRVKLVTLTSFWGDPHIYDNNVIGNVSYIDIQKALGYGFEISWMQAFCPCDNCYLKDPTGEIQCSRDDYSRWMYLADILFDADPQLFGVDLGCLEQIRRCCRFVPLLEVCAAIIASKSPPLVFYFFVERHMTFRLKYRVGYEASSLLAFIISTKFCYNNCLHLILIIQLDQQFMPLTVPSPLVERLYEMVALVTATTTTRNLY